MDQNQTPVLEVKHLYKALSGRPILSDINIALYPGEIFGFLGPNGSGKTTTIKVLLGLLSLERGEVKICGYDVKKDFEKAIANVGGIIENPEMYKQLTGRENLQQYWRMYDNVPETRIDEVTKIVNLEERINDKISKYSLGMRQRLGIAQAILARPKLLVLDEPTNGLDPAGIKELRDILRTLAKEENVAVLISSHQLSELELMCDRVGIIDRGVTVGQRDLREQTGSGTKTPVIYDIETPDKERASAALSGMAMNISDTESGICVKVLRDDIPAIVGKLVSADVKIYGLNMRKKSLEDTFLEVTHWNTPGAAADTQNQNRAETTAIDYEGGERG